MPAAPVILFSSFRSAHDPMRGSWFEFRSNFSAPRGRGEVATLPQAADGGGEAGIWRLLASNNRELARSSFLYGSFLLARAHVLKLRDLGPQLETITVRGPRAGSYGWFARVGDVPVITCARWYGSAAASLRGAREALAAFSGATVGEEPQRTTTSGRRTSRLRSMASEPGW